MKARAISERLRMSRPAGIYCPTYDRKGIVEGIVHLGVGAFHRSHQALYMDELIENHGQIQWGICGVGIMPQDARLHASLLSQDCLYTLVERSEKEDHGRLVASLQRHLFGMHDPEAVFAVLAAPDTRIVSITATEGGYCMNQSEALDEADPGVLNDLKTPESPRTIFGYLAEGLDRRRRAGNGPLTVLSCDNIQGNGTVARRMLLAFCECRDSDLACWVDRNIAFPESMVDRITPQTTDTEIAFVQDRFNLDDKCPVVCESFRQWVVQDHFCNDRPPFEEVGVKMVDDVHPYEKMKIRLLNASHTAMAYLGYLSGYRFIHDIARDSAFAEYIGIMMDHEVSPLLDPVPGIDLRQYKASLISRFRNRAIRDQVLRICSDGSGKMPKFVLPSIAEQLARGGPIRHLTLCVASWIRFLSGVDEQGAVIPYDDPKRDRLYAAAAEGGSDPRPVLALEDIFGRDLSNSGRFVNEVEALLTRLHRFGARATLRQCLANHSSNE